jgi:hypothetical protein
MAKKIEQDLIIREKTFNIDEAGYINGGITCELHGTRDSGTVTLAFIELRSNGKVCLISDVTKRLLTKADNQVYLSVSGQLDGKALPDSYQIHYCLSRHIDSVRAEPKLPSNMGSSQFTIPPKTLLGRSKWNSSGGNKVKSLIVHNRDGEFYVSGAIELGSNWERTHVVVRYNMDDYSSYLFENYKSPFIFLSDQIVEGSETLFCDFSFFKAEKWHKLPLITELVIDRV